jgi:3-keto-5-aminohexanoate cleavage enzyme
MTHPVTLTAALTGPIASKADNPALPTTPDEIAVSAEAAAAAGAAVVHIHLRDEQERPTADLDTARRVMDAIRQRTDALIQLSTGVGFGVPFAERAALAEVRPEMASLNVCSMTFGNGEMFNPPDEVRKLAARMRELDIKPEIEVYDTGHLEFALGLWEEGLLAEPLQFSIVLGVRGGARPTPQQLLSMVDRLPASALWQVIAIGAANLPLTTIGLAIGGNARTGMEDTLMMSRGVLASSNAELVSRLALVANTIGRPINGPQQVREALALRSLTDQVSGS